MRLICEHSDYPFTSARWTLPPAKLIQQIFLAMKVLKLNAVLLVVVVAIMKIFLVVILGKPEYTEPINQLNLVLRAAVVHGDELNSSRLENLHWCTFHHYCTLMPTFIACKML